MRIGLNLLHAMPEIGGGWNYIARLVHALGQSDLGNTYVAFVTERSAPLVREQEHFEIVPVDIDSRARTRRILYENTALQVKARRYRLDLMHWFANTAPVFNAVPGVVTVYDLLALEQGRRIGPARILYSHLMYPHTVRTAARLLPMSVATARKLCSLLHADPAKIDVIPSIVSDAFSPAGEDRIAALKRQMRLPDDFWLYVAHFYPHKNHLGLLRAYRALKAAGVALWPLILRGNDHGCEAEVRQAVRTWNLESDVRFLPELQESDVAVLFSAASALVFPSLYEGGGLPLLEAVACGCPVLASDVEAIREYAGDDIVTFDPRDQNAIMRALRDFQQSIETGVRQRGGAEAHVAQYRPRAVATRLHEAYLRAATS